MVQKGQQVPERRIAGMRKARVALAAVVRRGHIRYDRRPRRLVVYVGKVLHTFVLRLSQHRTQAALRGKKFTQKHQRPNNKRRLLHIEHLAQTLDKCLYAFLVGVGLERLVH